MACCASVLETPEPHGHFVQLYDRDPTQLSRNVARYLSEGLQNRENAILVAMPEHVKLFLADLRNAGSDPEQAIHESRLLVLDAERTLGELMIDGNPNWDRFEKVITSAMRQLRVSGSTGLRAYGEMVGVLWTAGQYTAAMRLEEFWNRLLETETFSLFCSYPIDIFSNEFQTSGVDAVLRDHTHLIPTGMDEALESALTRAMDERLGSRAQGIRRLSTANYRPAWAVLPKAEGTILWLRNNLPQEAETILSLARHYFRTPEVRTA